MIFLTEKTIKNPSRITDYIEKNKNYIQYIIISQQKMKNIILNCMQNFASSTDDIDINCVDITLKFLEDLKGSLNLCNENISLLNDILKDFDDILLETKNSSTELIYNVIDKFNIKYEKSSETIAQNTIKIENYLDSIFSHLEPKFIKPDKFTDIHEISKNTSESQVSENSTNNKKYKDNCNYVENTLIISETSGKVFLPYTLNELNEILKNNSDKYSSIDDIINQNYTLPIELFKNPFISRFRETFKLIRNREKKSIKTAFDLGLELMFNYNLHPAIISACKTQDELDIYLDYLETGETQKFDCFKVIFNIAPTIIK